MCPKGKKEDKLQCSSYRGICLLNVLYEIVSNILRRRLVPYLGEISGDYLCGFRRGRSTVGNLNVLRYILENVVNIIY